MPDLQTHIELAPQVVATGAVSAFVGMMFDIPPDAVLCAFVGCWIGLFACPAVQKKDTDSTKEQVMWYLKTTGLVLLSTVATAWAVPFAQLVMPGIAAKSMAGFIGFVMLRFRNQILKRISREISTREIG